MKKELEKSPSKFAVKLKPWQYDFVYSKKKLPAMVAAWATGKTLCGILRAMLYSQLIPNNLGYIIRREYQDLKDSTCKDFESYTQIDINSAREAEVGSSTILFRHIEELSKQNLQNVNLGWFLIEQADELESDLAFFMLLGRLRRNVQPSEAFNKLQLAPRSGFCIANSGDHWMKPLWKGATIDGKSVGKGKLEDADLVEAKTHDNADVLPRDYLSTLGELKTNKPEIYKQFVENSWDLMTRAYVLITNTALEQLKGVSFSYTPNRKLVTCDPAIGGDECVLYALHGNGEIIEEKILHLTDTQKIGAEAVMFMNKHEVEDFVNDSIGIGKGVADYVRACGKTVHEIISSEKAFDEKTYANKKAEIWAEVALMIQRKEVPYPDCEILRKQITAVKHKVGTPKFQLVKKIETKKELGQSPDRADAWIQGVYKLQDILTKGEKEKQDAYDDEEPVGTGFMAC